MHDLLLKDLIIILGTTLPISFVFNKLRLPTLIGYIFAGIIIGPYGVGLIKDSADVEVLAEIGVVLLLFTIGLEFSLARMIKNIRTVIGCGSLQLTLTILGIILISYLYGFSLPKSIFYGFLICLSSTAIVLKLCTERGEINSPHGKITIGILLFQDIFVVVMMLLIPVLGSASSTSPMEIVLTILKALGGVFLIFFSARLLVPKLLRLFIHFRSRETIILLVILICMGTAWLSESFGLSLAMGAFIAGLIISESEYSHQIVVEILPFRDFFSSIFFVSIGMLLHVQYFLQEWNTFLLLTIGIIFLKLFLAFLAVYLIQRSFRVSFITGIYLAQIGEFSFLMAGDGLIAGLMDNREYQAFLICAVLSMLATPLLIKFAGEILHRIQSLISLPEEKWEEPAGQMEGHVIIVGFGLNGKNLAHVLKETQIEFLVIDLNGDRLNQANTLGISTLYGDITRREIIHKVGIRKAKIIVFAISDLASTRRGVVIAREMNPNITILVRTRYTSEIEDLTSLGANQVIPMEFETSVEIFSRVLKEYNVPGNVIRQNIEMMRIEGYGMLRGLSLAGDRLKEFWAYLAKTTTINHLVLDNSQACSKTVKELDLKLKTGSTILTILRGNDYYSQIATNFEIKEGDVLIIMGNHAQLAKAEQYLASGN